MKRFFFTQSQNSRKTQQLGGCLSLFIIMTFSTALFGQENQLRKQYIGILPSILVEPYDTINAVEINTVPFVYEFRWGNQYHKGIQFRPIVNYRFFKNRSGISHLGGTAVMNWYLLKMIEDDFWLKPLLGAYSTYSFNRLDKVQTMTFGVEIGAIMMISKQLTLSFQIQPGINYYPDQFSKDFVKTESGFKSHFGLIFQLGYHF